MKKKKILISTAEGKYPILIGKNIVSKTGYLLKKNKIFSSKVLLVVDKKVPNRMVNKIKKSINQKKILFYLKSSEKNKSQDNVNKILNVLLKNNFNRNDCLISIGGGITGDLSAFIASVFKRGIHYVSMPTTLLAQVDSSIGGKTGINSKFGKNLIGTFYQPKLVISDISFLKSLPKREIICGYAEIFKHSLISNRSFFNFLNKNIKDVLKFKSPYIEKSIYKSCIIKKKVVEKDFKEKGLRKILNFGHTFAHAYEASLNFSKKLNHGEAVILGMKSAFEFSKNEKLITYKEFNSAIKHLNNYHFPVSIKNYFTIKKINQIISFMMRDKKNNSKNIKLMLIKKIGGPIIEKEISDVTVKLFLKKRLIN